MNFIHYIKTSGRVAWLALMASANISALDAVVGTGTPASCTEPSFNAALALVVNDNQGGTLTFNCGPDPDIILLSTAKNLVNFVTLDGGGKMTLDGQDLTRLFNINQDGPEGRTEVTLRNINLNRGNAGAEPFGGAILVNANTRLILDQVTISNSLASVAGGAIATFAGVTLDINNSRFLSNLAANGGAIATRAVATVTGSSFINNNASGGEGGAIQSYEQNLIISRSNFSLNSARLGGAIFKGNAVLDFQNSNFTANSSSEDGGAIYLRADLTAAFGLNSELRGNAAVRDGGGVFSRATFIAESSTFTRNSARAGGAIRMDGGELLIDKLTLSDNTATTEGGAISVLAVTASFGANPKLRHITTSNNTVSSGSGGDLAFSSSNGITALIDNTTLMGAAATNGASINLTGSMRLQIERSLIWARAGSTCTTAVASGITSLGGNIGPLGCGMNAPSDAISSTFAGFGLGEFANYDGRVNTFLPLPSSPVIDRGGSGCLSLDARRKPAPIDGDANGSALCDAGAVERQLREPPPALFRNGFESE